MLSVFSMLLISLCFSGCAESPGESEHTEPDPGAAAGENLSEAYTHTETDLAAIAEESLRNDYTYTEYEGRFLRQTGFAADPVQEDRYTLTYLYDVRTGKLPESVTGFSVELILEEGEIVKKTYTELPEAEYPALFSQEINAQHVSVHNGILLEGTSTLPEATVLRSQLFADWGPESWWPKNTTAVIRNGKWKFEVALGVAGRPEKLGTEAEYLLLVWKEDEPAVRSGIYFDLSGPPAPEE